ncbi:hypothetical protein E1193_09950 [Micromonospora sp. KC606]|uniref:hypothetical protein n=1 Tax=Micromonospora sp. KC606 TaxID=2530379 RepID=UPI00104EDC18|nr:hypothetical protein [Micromonospora sp. KC606]TDC83084.1 hypothetical protein E1193_09950 [Micromonospora sp. KC606]
MLTWGGRRVAARPSRAATPRRLLAGTLLALLVTVLAPPPPAAAQAPVCPPGQDDCSIWDDDPGTPGDPGGPGGGGDGGGGRPPAAKCQWNGRPLPCYSEILGWFNNGDGCYYKLAEPQGEAPEGSRWYVQTCNGGDLGQQRMVLLETPPAGFGAPPDPEELARRVLARLSLLPPRIAVAPRRDTGPGLVGLPVWMWAEEGLNYFGPTITESEEDRGLRVELVARFDRIVWNMGNGVKVTCTGPGTAYDPKGPHAGKASPDCGYDSGYPKPSDEPYLVSATTYWSVTWRGGGESGEIPQTRTSGTIPIEIDELQVVTR